MNERSVIIEEEEKIDNASTPEGWSFPKEYNTRHFNDFIDAKNEHRSIVFNLPIAAKRVEELISELNERLEIHVPISYLRIDEGTSFHVLLLVSQLDYLSPHIHGARLLAKQFAHEEDMFDMHFQFSVMSENMVMDSLLSQGYKLMHVQDKEQSAA